MILLSRHIFLLAGCVLPLRSPFNANIPIFSCVRLSGFHRIDSSGNNPYIFAFLSFFMMSQTVLTFPAPMSSTVSPGRTFAFQIARADSSSVGRYTPRLRRPAVRRGRRSC